MAVDKKQFAAGMHALGAAFNRPVDQTVIRVYYGVVGADLTSEQFESAVRELLRTERFMPAPAQILEAGKAQRTEHLMIEARKTPEQIERDREEFAKGFNTFKAALEGYGIYLDRIGKSM